MWVEHPPAGSNLRCIPECGHPGCILRKYGYLAENTCRADPANSRSAILGRWRYAASGERSHYAGVDGAAIYDNCLLSMFNFVVKYIHVGEYILGFNETIS